MSLCDFSWDGQDAGVASAVWAREHLPPSGCPPGPYQAVAGAGPLYMVVTPVCPRDAQLRSLVSLKICLVITRKWLFLFLLSSRAAEAAPAARSPGLPRGPGGPSHPSALDAGLVVRRGASAWAPGYGKVASLG